MEYIKLSDNELRQLKDKMTDWRYKNNFQSYLETYFDDEYYDLVKLTKDCTGVDFPVWLDENRAYKRYNHPLWLYLEIDPYLNFPIPISISDNPQIMINGDFIRNKIPYKVYLQLIAFIKKNKKAIIKLANKKISNYDFIFKYLKESYLLENFIFEMATLKSSITGLACDIWVDNSPRNLQHGKRIKFKANKDQHDSKDYLSMTISDNPEIKIPKGKEKLKEYRIDLSQDEIRQLKRFVKENKKYLLLLTMSNSNYTIKNFYIDMKKINEQLETLYPKTFLSFPII